jgi:hypothetical protein
MWQNLLHKPFSEVNFRPPFLVFLSYGSVRYASGVPTLVPARSDRPATDPPRPQGQVPVPQVDPSRWAKVAGKNH